MQLLKQVKQLIRELEDYFKNVDKPKLDYQSPETYIDAYSDFYDEILASTEVLQD